MYHHDIEWGYLINWTFPSYINQKTLNSMILIHFRSTGIHISDHNITNLSYINVWVHIFTPNTLFGNPLKGFVSTPSLRRLRYMYLPHDRIFSNWNLPLQNMDPTHNLCINLNNREWYGHAQWISGDVVDDNQPPPKDLYHTHLETCLIHWYITY